MGSIKRLESTLLYKKLICLEQKDHELSEEIKKIVDYLSPLLSRIPENLPEYTLHDSNHSTKIVELMGLIIPNEVLEQLDLLEVGLLILSAYFHDIGMTCSKEEKEEIIRSSEEFKLLMKLDSKKNEEHTYAIQNNNHRLASLIEDQLFSEYLRKNHIVRAENFIVDNIKLKKFNLSLNGIPFHKHLMAICNSHGEPVKSLYNLNLWPRNALIGNKTINIQYISIILRLADILDLDSERTPKVIYEFVNPQNPVSIIEWKKHRAIIGWKISHNKILFEAECSQPEVERALRQFIEWIEIERRESIELLNNYYDDISKKYRLELTEPVTTDRIRSDGSYLYCDLKFQIDYKKVLELLMGERLYKNSILALRELLQNSIDAIKVREKLYLNKNENFTPRIVIKLDNNELIISDNGLGMDENVFQNYFLQIGKSYYSSNDFYSKFDDVEIISEFGIGILSTFMIANSITIESRREPDNPLKPQNPIYYEIPTAYGYFVKKVSHRLDIGTDIRLMLKENHPFKNISLRNVLEELIPVSPYPINVITEEENFIHERIAKPEINVLKFGDSFDLLNEKQLWGKNYTHKLIDISFYEENDKILRNIQGKVSIVNNGPINFTSTIFGKITQQSFTIGQPNFESKTKTVSDINICKIFPKWTNYYSSINFTKTSCLTLTPDRTDVITNDKYYEMQKKLENIVIRKFEEHFEDIRNDSTINFDEYIDFLIHNGFIGMPYENDISNEARLFLQEIISFPVVNHDGSVTRMLAKEIIDRENIGVVTRNWKNTFDNEIANYLQENNITLIVLNKYEYVRSYYMERFFVNLIGEIEDNVILISTIPGVKVKIVRKNSFCEIKSREKFISRIRNNLLDDSEILCVQSDSAGFDHIFNNSHKLFMSFNENADATIINELLDELHYKFMLITREAIDSIEDFNNPKWLNDLRSNNHDVLCVGILKKDKKLIAMYRQAIEEFWNRGKEMKIINSSESVPEITEKDFPWYWSK